MIEKVNPSHPDKIADRIAGAILDLAYTKEDNPKIAVEVLIGHGVCHIIAETSVKFDNKEIESIVSRIAGDVKTDFVQVPQDKLLAENQSSEIRCGDNGIFKGMPVTREQLKLSNLARQLYDKYPSDGKYLIDTDGDLIVCQSNAPTKELEELLPNVSSINPLGDWTGGTDVDTGATNRKLGSDMADSVTGGGLHGKDLSKADVTLNIYAFVKANLLHKPVELSCAIRERFIDGIHYEDLVEFARIIVKMYGGFEGLAEWGLF